MAIEFKIVEDSITDFLKAIENRTKQIERQEKAVGDAIGIFVFQDVIDHFDTENGPTAGWDPWSKMYAIHMFRIGKGGNKLLQNTGRLRNTFKAKSWRKRKDGELEWFNNAKTKSGFPYAAHHDDGPSSSMGNSRKFMWLSDAAMDKIANLTLGFALRGKL